MFYLQRIVIGALLTLLSIGISAQKKIELSANLSNKKSKTISSVAKDIKYIPLETTPECLLSNELQIYCGDYVFVGDQKTQLFFRFDLAGNLLNQIGKKGNGPGEYSGAMFFHVNESDESVYIVSVPDRNLYKYTYDGRFIKKIPIEESSWTIAMDENNIYYYNNYYNRIKKNKNIFELFKVDKNGKVINKTPTSVKSEKDDMLLFDLPFFYYYKNVVYYKNAVHDFVYKINDKGKMEPHYEIVCKELNKHDENDFKNLKKYGEKVGVRTIFENDSFLLITYIYKNEFNYLFVDKPTWSLSNVTNNKSESGFEEDLKKGPVFTPVQNNGSEKNKLVSIVYPERFSDLKNCLDKEINEDDNPVIVIANLK
ncbi:6-bladed beta-propeller [Massilibacteroides sp.]|uniref:6-bladed beta-propeller n=1 Tax=Massilibacteroides sp. TaxID=2034766 RepID=UPI002616F4EB|nr:6-bladed beta-propeller [Massilibacteroides sp.]MDD4515173.1 6-bladed beta-propeller [Massilibacteroides sp.]